MFFIVPTAAAGRDRSAQKDDCTPEIMRVEWKWCRLQGSNS